VSTGKAYAWYCEEYGLVGKDVIGSAADPAFGGGHVLTPQLLG
jgi:hypothetical protein